LNGRNFIAVILILLAISLLQSCSIKKYLGKDNHLIRKYQVKVENKPEEIDVSDLRTFFRPWPNKRFLGIYMKLYSYYKKQEKPTKFNKWRDKNFGEYPVIYDENQADRIAYKMEKYLDNVGFFHSKVSYTVEFRKRTARLFYTVIPAQPYHISNITYDIPDSLVRDFFNKNLNATLIKDGDIYNAYTFDDERDRITKDLRDAGYYYFNRNYIQFTVDSSFSNHTLTVVLKINDVQKPIPGEPGKFTEQNHKRYFIKNVNVIPDFKPGDSIVYDTVLHNIRFWNKKETYTYTFLMDKKRRIKPKAFNTAINIKPGQPYSASSVQSTYRQLFNYSILKTASISFDTTGAGSKNNENHHYLNSRIQMQMAKVNTIQLESIGTNSSGDLGIRGNVVYSNRNIFKRGEVFSLNIKGGFEAQTVPEVAIGGSGSKLFNTFEAGVSGNIYFPRFWFPGRLKKFNQKYNPVTNLNFGYSYQKRPYYSRNITTLSIGYSWSQTKVIRHILTPVNINYVNIFRTPEFDSLLEQEQNPRVVEQYSDHMVLGLNYSFILNNQNLKSLRHFNYFRFDFESSGNLLYGLNTLFNSPKTREGYYEFTGVRYSQFIRTNFDYRHYYYFNQKTNSLVVRFLLGMAIPYLNSNEITFEKGFYAGGANDMRGWKFRTLGPGGYRGQGNYERIGEIQIEGNAEYRFPIYNVFKGAFFVDAGNIWNLKKSETFPDGEFYWNSWYQQLAMDMGIGLRLDFQFFVFRLDVAIPVRDPAYPQNERWRFNYLQFNDFVLNFGIGYPF